jgi:hypothetical protein
MKTGFLACLFETGGNEHEKEIDNCSFKVQQTTLKSVVLSTRWSNVNCGYGVCDLNNYM